MSPSPRPLANVSKCGLRETLLFALAVLFGTACSISGKIMLDLEGTNGTVDSDGEPVVEAFQQPLFLTFSMFLGMLFGLVMHWVVVAFRVPFPGYDFADDKTCDVHSDVSNGLPNELTPLVDGGWGDESDAGNNYHHKGTPAWMYFFLAIPAIFDLGATALCMMGLQYLDVSIFQLLRGSCIIFVALMKQHVMKEHLHKFHWTGVFWNVVSVVIVGATALLASAGDGGGKANPKETFLGVCLMMAGAFVQAVQFVFEEHVMKTDVPAPPLLLIGMEGFWGTLLSLVIMYPIGYYMPGNDHGSYEDPFNTWAMIVNTRSIQVATAFYIFTVFMYNLLAVLVTFLLSSVWHAILDNFRPITVWATDLLIFYWIDPLFGETWTPYSYLQVVGMAVLLYGTAIYNAPNDGSLLLRGQWWALGIDFSDEYTAIRRQQEEEELDAMLEVKRREFEAIQSGASGSPYLVRYLTKRSFSVRKGGRRSVSVRKKKSLKMEVHRSETM